MKYAVLAHAFAVVLAAAVAGCGSDSSSSESAATPMTQTGPTAVSTGPAAASCAPSISGNPTSVPGTGGRYTLAVTTGAGCAWTAQVDAAWASVTPGTGVGSASPILTVDENVDVNNTRSANLTVGGQVLHFSQANGCNYTIDVTTADFTGGGNRMGIELSTRDGCAWTASSTETWLRVSPTRGSGSFLIDLEAATNFGGVRHATVTIAGKRVAVSQQTR